MERRKEGEKEDKKGDTGKVVVGGAAWALDLPKEWSACP